MGSLKTPQIICESDALENHVGLLPKYGKTALIVTGPHVGKSAMMLRLTAVLDRDGVGYEIFAGITSEPTDVMIADGVATYYKGNCDFCIAIGGGSPLDAAKAIAAMITNPGTVASYMGKEIGCPTPPVVAIPTTAGTGSEATPFTIITDTQRGIKMLLKGDVLLPQLAIVDYTMGMTAPKSVTASTGIDALTHAVEAYISRKAKPETDELAVKAIKRILQYLPIAYADGNNAEARKEMAQAALEAGICICNSSVTVVHGMSRPIGALFHVPHGLSNAMLLTTCFADIIGDPGAAEKVAELSRATGASPEIATTQDAAIAFVEALRSVCRACEVPTLAKYGIDRESYIKAIDKMANDAIASGSPANAPKLYTADDCKRLYVNAYGSIVEEEDNGDHLSS